jgi:hypothetical protein
MSAYEFRFLNERGSVLVFYFARCRGDEDARTRIETAAALGYARFEIWQDDRKVAAGHGTPWLM